MSPKVTDMQPHTRPARRRRALPLALVRILSLAANAAAAQDLYDSPADKQPHFRKVLARIQIQQPTLRAFVQHKTLAKLNRNLRSSGLLLISPQGVCWRNETPFASAMRMTPAGNATARPGEPVRFARAAASAANQNNVTIMLALFSADEAQLKRAFQFYFTGDDTRWTIGFKPSRRELRRLITAVELSGTRDVEKIVIREASGDVSEIRIAVPPPGQTLTLEQCIE